MPAPVAPVAPTYVEPAQFDFRRVALDDSVIGTTQACDISDVYPRDTATGPVLVNCLGHDGHASRIDLTVEETILPALEERTQLRVRIDGPGRYGSSADAEVTLVEIAGAIEPPEPPRRCLCSAEYERKHSAARPVPPVGFSFAKYDHDRAKYWGTTQICRVGQVSELMRSSPEAHDYSIGRVFDPEQLPYAARVLCNSDAGSETVVIGSTSLEVLLDIDRDQAIKIELGWSSKNEITGRLQGIAYTRGDRDD